jgi:hypothetical protein
MTELKHPDTLHLQAARGWLELGNHLEANEELEKITASLRAHPAVLEVRWRIYAKAEKWKEPSRLHGHLLRSCRNFRMVGSIKQKQFAECPARSQGSLDCSATSGR